MSDFPLILKSLLPDAVLEAQQTPDGYMLEIAASGIRQVFAALAERRDEDGHMLITDIGAVHYENDACRFELFYRIFMINLRMRLTLKCRVAGGEIDSVADIAQAALMPEREISDMFGLRFNGHANMPRLFMHGDFEGHPLLRSYPLRKRQILIERTKFE